MAPGFTVVLVRSIGFTTFTVLLSCLRMLSADNTIRRLLAEKPASLDTKARRAVKEGIQETCDIRKWTLWAFNCRTNHVHAVVSANCNPKRIVIGFKANATRKMREASCWRSDRSPWVGGGGSKEYLWTEKELSDAIAYVLYDQGEPLPE